MAATNWQNAIKQSDLRANDFEQVRIDREFRRLNYQYLRKRQSKGEVKRQFGTPGRFQIKKEQLARAVAAAELDPASVLTGTEKLFENDYYTRIFDGRPAKDYLALVWLDRHVNYAARGRERRYARWLALNYIWRSLQHLLRREPVKDRFLYLSERVSEWNKLRNLDRFIRLMLRAALTFYRHKRGKGIEAMDLFTFFKQRKLDVEFDKYLVRSGSVLRGRARKALARFEKVLISEG